MFVMNSNHLYRKESKFLLNSTIVFGFGKNLKKGFISKGIIDFLVDSSKKTRVWERILNFLLCGENIDWVTEAQLSN